MIVIQKIDPDDGTEAVSLIVSLAEEFVFPDYTEEGKEVFRRYVTPASLVADDAENFSQSIRLEGALVGVAKIKRGNHLSMLFVAGHCQGRGYGRLLLRAVMEECKARNPEITCITANSSRFGLPFFLKQGFQIQSEETQISGIKFTYVKLEIADAA